MAQRQGSPKNDRETYVLEVGNEMVTLADFKHVYGKNNRDSVYTIEALDNYMELFVNFKLKVLEAEALGMDTAAAFKKELAGYRTQLARPYLVDGNLLDALVDEAFERKGMRSAATCSAVWTPTPLRPTPQCLNRIQALRTRVVNGEDFETSPQQRRQRGPLCDEQRWRLGWSCLSNGLPLRKCGVQHGGRRSE